MDVNSILEKVPKQNILKIENSFKRTISGVFSSKSIKDYGYNFEMIESIKVCSNICQYLLMKNKGL